MKECRIVATDETGHEIMNMTMDGFEDVSPQENVVIVLGYAFQEAIRLLPKERRNQIAAEVDAGAERAAKS